VIFKLFLASVEEKTLGKELFAECCIYDTRQRAFVGKETLCRVSKIKHSTKSIHNISALKESFASINEKNMRTFLDQSHV
jgi:hypothetical protein